MLWVFYVKNIALACLIYLIILISMIINKQNDLKGFDCIDALLQLY